MIYEEQTAEVIICLAGEGGKSNYRGQREHGKNIVIDAKQTVRTGSQ